jgi:aspartyl-tRNA synthetase
MKTFWRTHSCGELNEGSIGQSVTLSGWVDSERDHGGISFVDLRDRYGKTQVVIDPKNAKFEGTQRPKTEECLQITGTIQRRPKGTENSKIPTGQIELVADKVTLLSACQTPPFEVNKSTDTNEEMRMEYRYLDLRNPGVQKSLFARHKMYQSIRRTLDGEDFIEVETPILTKSTPEGARDYLVPSRVNQGEFYALPQSPQLFKQILMVSGFDRYFQIAKCFRDEDLRADRQPEFTQLDMEMAFVKQDDVFAVIEKVMKGIFKDVLGKDLPTPFARLTYQQAVNDYGTDKPDLRFGVKIIDVDVIVKKSEFKVFKEAPCVLGLCLAGMNASRKDIDLLTEFAKTEGAGGLAYFKSEGGKLEAPIAKFFQPEILEELRKKFDAKDGDLIVFAADEKHKAQKVLGAIRLHVSKQRGWAKPGEFNFSWVTDFPLFRWNEEDKRWDSEHHPFTSPDLDDWAKHKPSGALDKIRSSAYDLVLNGNELASGSIRIHNRDMQREIFKLIGLDEKEADKRFGFLLRAFEYGPPPHGGLAFGVDRLVAILLGLTSIREVIAFPKNQKAVDPMTSAPSLVDEKQLRELGIKIR